MKQREHLPFSDKISKKKKVKIVQHFNNKYAHMLSVKREYLYQFYVSALNTEISQDVAR